MRLAAEQASAAAAAAQEATALVKAAQDARSAELAQMANQVVVQETGLQVSARVACVALAYHPWSIMPHSHSSAAIRFGTHDSVDNDDFGARCEM